ncbi:MAG: hypothetical protein NDI77_06940 [Geobacteraceae bacterium]|nr:hypothetical protein [Geobacteraceae bacterium]
MKHPVLGVLATFLVVALSLWISVSMAPMTMIAWVTLLLVAMVPPQIVLTLALQGQHPASLARLPQPLRGVAFCALTAIIGLPIAAVANATLGGGLTPPTPFVNMFLILGVCVTLGLVAPFQCWPFSAIFPKRPLLMGASILVGAYAISALLFNTLFNFDFLQGAPFYRADLNPHGLFMAWIPLIFALTCFVVILCLVLLDFWPVAALPPLIPAVGKQPLFGIVSAIFIALVASGIWALFVGSLHMDMVVFLIRVIISLIFGIFILLIMMEGAQFVTIPQPARGGVLILVAVVLSMASFALYKFACQNAFGLPSGPPTYDRELWLASAMLAVTFPMMVAYANFFQFWPFRSAAGEGKGES